MRRPMLVWFVRSVLSASDIDAAYGDVVGESGGTCAAVTAPPALEAIRKLPGGVLMVSCGVGTGALVQGLDDELRAACCVLRDVGSRGVLERRMLSQATQRGFAFLIPLKVPKVFGLPCDIAVAGGHHRWYGPCGVGAVNRGTRY